MFDRAFLVDAVAFLLLRVSHKLILDDMELG